MSLEIPTVHLNGTGKKNLLEAIEEAHEKVRDAVKALAETSPNGRDYYNGLKAGAVYDRLQVAGAEHAKRQAALHQILLELEELAEGIAAQ